LSKRGWLMVFSPGGPVEKRPGPNELEFVFVKLI